MGKNMTTNEAIFKKILEGQELSTDQIEYTKTIEEKIQKVFKDNLNESFELYLGGSIVKKTALRDKYDFHAIINFPELVGSDLKQLHTKIEVLLKKKWKKGQLKNFGWNLELKKNMEVVIIPGFFDQKTNMGSYLDATNDRVIQTNFKAQNEYVLNSNRQDAIKLMKIWTLRRSIPIRSFFLELLVILGCRGVNREQIEKQVNQTFNFIYKNIDTRNFNDPINSDNNISKNITPESIAEIKELAKQVLEAKSWSKVFKK